MLIIHDYNKLIIKNVESTLNVDKLRYVVKTLKHIEAECLPPLLNIISNKK